MDNRTYYTPPASSRIPDTTMDATALQVFEDAVADAALTPDMLNGPSTSQYDILCEKRDNARAALLSRLEALEAAMTHERNAYEGYMRASNKALSLCESQSAEMMRVVEAACQVSDAPWNSAARQIISSDLRRRVQEYRASRPTDTAPTQETPAPADSTKENEDG
jgi:hypothetical protein